MKKLIRKLKESRDAFFYKNLFKGFLWTLVIVVGYFIVKKYFHLDLKTVLGNLYDNWVIIYLIYFLSEFFIGVIPPEFFMIWALKFESFNLYLINVLFLSLISYFVGIIVYFLGYKLGKTNFYQVIKEKYFSKYESKFRDYGGFLVVVAALTPVPFSGVCFIVGAAKYKFNFFLILSLTRFLRYFVYALFVWEANALS